MAVGTADQETLILIKTLITRIMIKSPMVMLGTINIKVGLTPKRTLYHTPKRITIIEILGTLKAITQGRVMATKTMTMGPPSGLIDQTKENHQLTADGEERRRREHTLM